MGLITGGDDGDRHRRILRTQEHEARKALDAWHLAIEQHQTDIAVAIETRRHGIERSGFVELYALEGTTHTLLQCGATQRMSIDNNDPVAWPCCSLVSTRSNGPH